MKEGYYLQWIQILYNIPLLASYAWYMIRFLTPKYSNKSYLLLFGIILFCNAILNFIAPYFYIKPLIYFMVYLGITFIFFKDTFERKFLCIIFLIAGSLCLEMFINFYMEYVLHLNIINIMNTYHAHTLYIVLNIAQVVLFSIIIRLFKNKVTTSVSYTKIYIAFGIQLYLVVTSFTQVQLVDNGMQNFIFYLINFIITLCMNVYVLYSLYKIYKRQKQEEALLLVKQSYQELLDFYLKDVYDEDMMRYVRHDIINYLEHIKHEKKDITL